MVSAVVKAHPGCSRSAGKPRAVRKTSDHPSYSDMIWNAVVNQQDRKGVSRQLIVKYIVANYIVSSNASTYISNQLIRMAREQRLINVSGSGAVGRFKVNKLFQGTTRAKNPVGRPRKTNIVAGKRSPAAARLRENVINTPPVKMSTPKKSASEKISQAAERRTAKNLFQKRPAPRKPSKKPPQKSPSLKNRQRNHQ